MKLISMKLEMSLTEGEMHARRVSNVLMDGSALTSQASSPHTALSLSKPRASLSLSFALSRVDPPPAPSTAWVERATGRATRDTRTAWRDSLRTDSGLDRIGTRRDCAARAWCVMWYCVCMCVAGRGSRGGCTRLSKIPTYKELLVDSPIFSLLLTAHRSGEKETYIRRKHHRDLVHRIFNLATDQ